MLHYMIQIVNILPSLSLTVFYVLYQLVFPLLLVAKIGIGIVLEQHGIALQRPQNCIGILLSK